MRRKGLMKGKGKGYKNVMGKDPYVHSQSARGIKQPQRIPQVFNTAETSIHKTKPKTDAEQELIDAFDSTTLKEIRKEFDFDKIVSFNEDDTDVFRFETDSGEEYYIFPDEERAEKFAEERVREDLENEPELFSQDWLNNFIYISDTDRRIIAQEESDYEVEEMDEEDILLDSPSEDRNVQELRGKIDETDDPLKIQKYEEQIEKEIEDARENNRSRIYEEIYYSLEDPINYFVDERGIYSKEDLLKQPFIQIDKSEALKDAIRTDGWQHFIATYDGDSTELPSGRVLVRLN